MSEEYAASFDEYAEDYAPEFMPVLAGGKHADPAQGACVMEYVSLLAGEPWSDSPSCTHPVLASVARNVNDSLPDQERQLLIPLIPRLFGTSPTGTQLEQRVLSVRLSVWAARRVHHLVREPDKAVTRKAIDAAQSWSDEPTSANAYAYAANAANAAYAANANAAAYAANAANAAANAAAYGANAAANAAAYGANAANAANAAAYAAAAAAYGAAANAYGAAANARVQFLSDLIDEYDRLVGRTQLAPVDLPALEAKRLASV